MDILILKNKIRIERLPVFLCGPAYTGEKYDRRIILRDRLNEIYVRSDKADILPLIVDNYLSRKNAMDFSVYNVQLMEEICAAISFQTHLFLDSMSTATELGIFVNSAFNNEVFVYIPVQRDVFNIFNSGDFVREIVLKNPLGNVKCVEYHPRIKTIAISSLCNHDTYEFNNDALPDNIEKKIIEQSKLPIEFDYTIKYCETTGFASDFNVINYTYHDDSLDVAISIKLLFYICVSLIGLRYQTITEAPDADVTLLYEDIIHLLVNSILYNSDIEQIDYSKTNVRTVLKYDTETIIKHMVAFLYYYKKGEGKVPSAKYFLTKENYVISSISNIGRSPFDVFGIDKKQFEDVKFLINEINPFDEYILVRNSKERVITKYNETKEGKILKTFHDSVNVNIRKIYKRTEFSFAYHQNISAIEAINKHINSKGFIKFDIKDFFGSIDINILADSMIKIFNIRLNCKAQLIELLNTAYVNGKLPLGLVLSPILSDIVMNDIDCLIGEFCKDKYIYTRYADDIMISSKDVLTIDEIREITNFISKELKRKKFRINDKKTRIANLDKNNIFIKYLGISIVHVGCRNILSVGKKYIYKLGDEYVQYLNELAQYRNLLALGFDNVSQKSTLFYKRLILIGKINYVLMVEGEKGRDRIIKRVKKYCSEEQLLLRL